MVPFSDRVGRRKETAMTTFQLQSIGRVQVGEQGFVLTVDEGFRAALRGLEGFSHLDVLFWCHHLDKPDARNLMVCERPYKKGPEKVGVFATRSPARPNPIALSPVQVLSVDHERGHIVVPFIDAEDGTPLIDIKPYHPATDRVRDVRVPGWCEHWPKWYEDNATFDWAAEFDRAE
jgi:tRNA (adenine37-N6)-methyltransferase